MKVFSGLALCAILVSQYASSQARSTSSEIRLADQDVEIFGGFALAGGGALGTGYGANGGLDFRIHRRAFVVIDVDQFRDNSASSSNYTSDTTILFGPRFVAVRPTQRMSVFGQVLMGIDSLHNGGQAYTYQYNSATNFAVAADGGFDYAFSRHLSARFSGGFLHSKLTESTYGGPVSPSSIPNNRGRFTVDLAYRFGTH